MGMKIFVKVNPNSKRRKIEEKEPPVGVNVRYFSVSVKSPPRKGRANEELIVVLADYFNTEESEIRIVSGQTSDHKVVELVES